MHPSESAWHDAWRVFRRANWQQQSACSAVRSVTGNHQKDKSPSVSHLREVAVATGTQFEWLATGRGAMTLSRDAQLDSIATAEAILVEDPLEFRLVRAFRQAPLKARLSLLEVMETLASQRTGRPRPREGARVAAPDGS